MLPLWEKIEHLKWLLASVSIGTLGGLTSVLVWQDRPITVREIARKVLGAIFVSIIVTLALADTSLSDTTKTAIAGASGYCAPDILKSFSPWVKRHFGMHQNNGGDPM